MTTFQDSINETRHHLMTGQQDKLNVLQTTVDNTTPSIQFTYAIQGIQPGATITIELEEMHVVDVSAVTPGSTITVIRGMNGSTAVGHDANALIRINPQFSDYRIGKYVNEALYDLSAEGLFRINSVEFDYNPSVRGYDFDVDDFIEIWRVRYQTTGPSKTWPTIPTEMWRLDRAANTSDFASGKALLIQDGGSTGRPIRVSYKQGFGQLTALTDDVLVTTGLHNEAHNIPPLGAAIALLGGREIKRSLLNRQPEPRRQQEVPPGSANQAMLPLIKRYEDRIRMEKRRLRRMYPGAY